VRYLCILLCLLLPFVVSSAPVNSAAFLDLLAPCWLPRRDRKAIDESIDAIKRIVMSSIWSAKIWRTPRRTPQQGFYRGIPK
jgi:hypothetical protein